MKFLTLVLSCISLSVYAQKMELHASTYDSLPTLADVSEEVAHTPFFYAGKNTSYDNSHVVNDTFTVSREVLFPQLSYVKDHVRDTIEAKLYCTYQSKGVAVSLEQDPFEEGKTNSAAWMVRKGAAARFNLYQEIEDYKYQKIPLEVTYLKEKNKPHYKLKWKNLSRLSVELRVNEQPYYLDILPNSHFFLTVIIYDRLYRKVGKVNLTAFSSILTIEEHTYQIQAVDFLNGLVILEEVQPDTDAVFTIEELETIAQSNLYKPSEGTLLDPEKEFTLIHFWGPWCGPCVKNLPAKNKFLNTPSLAEKFNFLDICTFSVKNVTQHLDRMILENKVREHQVIQYLLEEESKLLTAYKVEAYPTIIIIDEKGRALHRASKFDAALENWIRETLL